MAKGGKREFEPMTFPERNWRDTKYATRYHVYAGPDQRVVVQAETAAEAIRKAGVKRPVKVVRGLSTNEARVTMVNRGRLLASADQIHERPDPEDPRTAPEGGVVPLKAFAPTQPEAGDAAIDPALLADQLPASDATAPPGIDAGEAAPAAAAEVEAAEPAADSHERAPPER